MAVDSRTQAQARLVLDRHDEAAAHPAPDQWEDADDLHYLYREYAILVRQVEADRVTEQLRRILDDAGYGDVPEGDAREIRREEVSRGLVRLTVPPTPTLVPDLVARLDEDLWPGIAKPDHKVYLCPAICPATEPIEVPGNAAPVPPPGLDAGGAVPLGRKRRVRRVGQHRGHRADTGRRRQAHLAHRGAGRTRRIRTPLTVRATGFSPRTPATGRSAPACCAAWPRRHRSLWRGHSTSWAPTSSRGSCPAWRTRSTATRTSSCSPSHRPPTAISP